VQRTAVVVEDVEAGHVGARQGLERTLLPGTETTECLTQSLFPARFDGNQRREVNQHQISRWTAATSSSNLANHSSGSVISATASRKASSASWTRSPARTVFVVSFG
jgi:hypothetical protein